MTDYSRYRDDSWLTNNNWGKWGEDDEVGVLNEITPADVVKAVSLVRTGKVYDLETTRFHGMPVWDGHCGFELMTYASPKGRRNMTANNAYPAAYSWHSEGGWLDSRKDKYQIDANTEMLIAPLHCGTHIDGFGHITVGEDAHWYNGYNFEQHWGDYGIMKCDAPTIPPMILRGVLLDIAGYKGLDHVPANYGVTAEDIEECAEWEGVELKKKDCVLIRLGETWPTLDNCPGAGMTLEAARCLVEGHKAVLLGNDMLAFEMNHADGTMSWPEHPHPVHHYCLDQMGVHFMEAVQLDELAKDQCYEFCFMAAPNKIKGGTGMFIRPVAIT